MSVARPTGNAAMNKLWCGWLRTVSISSGVPDISQNRYESKEDKEDNIEHEEED